MDYLLVCLQGLAGILVFVVPGLALLSRVMGRRLAEWPLALLLAASFVVSSLMIAGLEAVCVRYLSVAAARAVAWCVVLAAGAYCVALGRKHLASVIARLGRWERYSLVFLGAIFLFWILAMPLSPYPSHLYLRLGDPPVYYRAAANLAAGRGWAPDYFLADYPGGVVPYVASHPAPALVTTFLFRIFGANWYSLYVYDALAGSVLLWLAVGVVRSAAPDGGGRHVLFLTLGLALVPAHFLLFGLGVVTAPGALAFLTAVALVLAEGTGRGTRCLMVALSLVLMVLWRPDSAMLAVLLAVAYGLWWAAARLWATWPARVFLVAACAAAGVGLWLSIPAVFRALPPSWRTTSLFCLRYDARAAKFVETVTPWVELNRRLCRANLAGEDYFALAANPAIGGELRAHPLAALAYLGGQFLSSAPSVAEALTAAEYRQAWPEGAVGAALAAVLVLLAIRSRGGLVLAGAMLAYVVVVPLASRGPSDAPSAAFVAVVLALMTRNRGGAAAAGAVLAYVVLVHIVNPGAGARHMLVATPAALALALRPLWRRWHASVRVLLANRAAAIAAPLLVLAFLGCWGIIHIRTYELHRTYAPILRDLERLAGTGDVIASSYPQLVTCMTGRRSVGGTWLTENLAPLVRRFQPTLIVVDNAHIGCRNYDELMAAGGRIPGYEVAVHNAECQYIIFRAAPGQRPGGLP